MSSVGVLKATSVFPPEPCDCVATRCLPLKAATRFAAKHRRVHTLRLQKHCQQLPAHVLLSLCYRSLSLSLHLYRFALIPQLVLLNSSRYPRDISPSLFSSSLFLSPSFSVTRLLASPAMSTSGTADIVILGIPLNYIIAAFLTASPITSYADQMFYVWRRKSSDGFALDTCALLIAVSTLRIFFWFGRDLELPIFLQSCSMLGVQLVYLKLALMYMPAAWRRARSMEDVFIPFKRPFHFWQWKSDWKFYLVRTALSLFISLSVCIRVISVPFFNALHSIVVYGVFFLLGRTGYERLAAYAVVSLIAVTCQPQRPRLSIVYPSFLKSVSRHARESVACLFTFFAQ